MSMRVEIHRENRWHHVNRERLHEHFFDEHSQQVDQQNNQLLH